MKRRTFVGAAFSGLGLTSLSARPPKPRQGDIPTREFGRTGVKLTVIGQGGARMALIRSHEDARSHLRHAFALGLNYFDCAHSYWEGQSEEVYGQALKEVRKEVFLTSKTTMRTAREARQELEVSLKRLQTDYIDLWQIHGVETLEDVEKIFNTGGAIEAFEAAKLAGQCRFIGFTGHHDPAVHLEMLRRYRRFDSILMPLHAADPSYLSFEKNVLPVAVERGMAIQGMKVFGNAFLLRALNPKDCLTYVLSLPVHCAAVGCSTTGQLDEDVRIVQDFSPLSESDMGTMRRKAVEGTGVLSGPALEYWKRT